MSLKTDNSKIKKDQLYNYVQQKPNRRTLFVFKFHLSVYNLANSGKERKWKNWIKDVIGEKPVIYDSFLEKKTKKQLELYMKNRGYYNSIIKDTVKYKGKKVNVEYAIVSNEPHRISNINYEVQDSLLEDFILSDAKNSLIKPNNPLDIDILQKERIRIANRLQDSGYYRFSKEYIYYEVDTLLYGLKAEVTIGLKKFIRKIDQNNYVSENHRKYKINKINIYTDFDPKYSFDPKEIINVDFDTIMYKEVTFIYKEKLKIKPEILLQSIYIALGDFYSKQKLDQSYEYLSALRLFRLININFTESLVKDETDKYGLLSANIYLSPLKEQSFVFELEGTNSSASLSGDNIGFASNLIYRHKNLFRGAELFDVSLTGAFGILPVEEENKYTSEYGIESNLYIPKFLLPIKTERFIKKYNPKTIIPAVFNRQRRPDFDRDITNFGFGYYWNSSKTINHIFKPLNLNFVKYSNITNPSEGLLQFYSGFQDQFIPFANYTLIINNQLKEEAKNYSYILSNIEFAGNLFNGLGNWFDWETSDEGNFVLFETAFAQYFKFNVDYRYYWTLLNENQFVFRGFVGAGFPYGNSGNIPYIKQFYSGGAYSIRAWQARSLGPGKINYRELDVIYPNQLGDIKLEANLEYRFDMFWILEGALFVDVGNIWYQTRTELDENGVFKLSTFYNQLAVGTGFGTRLDFSFFVFRIDLGFKTYDPSEGENGKWVLGRTGFDSGRNMVFNIGVGYPF